MVQEIRRLLERCERATGEEAEVVINGSDGRAWRWDGRAFVEEAAAPAAVTAERERIARIVDEWEPFAGVFSKTDLARFIRRGDD